MQPISKTSTQTHTLFYLRCKPKKILYSLQFGKELSCSRRKKINIITSGKDKEEDEEWTSEKWSGRQCTATGCMSGRFGQCINFSAANEASKRHHDSLSANQLGNFDRSS
jgi:hypothetical protein